MKGVHEEIKIAIEFSARMSESVVADLSGVAGLLAVCYEQKRLPVGVKGVLDGEHVKIMDKLDALSQILGAVVHNI